MRAEGGSRIEWSMVPAGVRSTVEAAIGARVMATRNCAGGFSPGVAAVAELDDGRRCFLKAVSPAQNVQACRVARREIEVSSQLPAWVPAPELHHVHDDGEWVVAVFEHIDGDQPAEPWRWHDLERVLPSVVELGRRPARAEFVGLQEAEDRMGVAHRGWRRFASGDGDATAIPAWLAARIDELAEIETGWAAAAAGDALVHADLRADNVLLTDTGAVFVDWPHACLGADFVDLVALLPSVGLGGGPTPAEVTDRFDLFAHVDAAALTSVVAAVCGYFTRAAQDPPPPGLPRLRAFQQAQADIAQAWLRTLL